MVADLRDELESLRIERRGSYRPEKGIRRGPGIGRRLTTLVLWLIPLSVVAAGAYYVYTQFEQVRATPEVAVGQVQLMTLGEAEKLLSAKGYLKSRHQAMIGARGAGRVEQMLVEEGTKVKKDQILAILEHDDIKALLESRKASIERTRAELDEAHADRDEKERKYKREMKLFQQKSTSIELVDAAEAEWKKAEARIKALIAGISFMEASAKEITASIENMHIRAPFDGTILEKGAEEGETLTPGGMGAASGRGSVATLADLSQLEVETDITESLLSRVRIGQPAEISVSAVPDRRYRGRLRQIIPFGDRTRGTVKVKVQILDPDEELFPELAATVHFLPDKSRQDQSTDKPLIFVPRSALKEENGRTHVWVLGTGNALHRQEVEVIVSNDELARVETGLHGGETVVLDPTPNLRESVKVRVAQ